MSTDKEMKEVLDFDGLATSEKITGKSYKEDKLTESLGFLLMLDNNSIKRTKLKSRNDTYHGISHHDYTDIISRNGFEKVLSIPFEGYHPDEYQIWWHKFGLLLSFDTYGEPINGGKLYYNINFDCDDWYLYTSSGYMKDDVWVGDHDCREALIFNISQLHEHGTLLPKWHQRPFLWFLHYMDTKDKDYDHKKITEERIEMLPKHVRNAITP